jgi:hypothetical protein
MRTRVLVLSGLAAILCPFGFVACWLALSPGRISQETCSRINVGMTLAEVETVLGGPAGAYTFDRQDWSGGLLGIAVPTVKYPYTRKVWVSDEGGIIVDFDKDQQVVAQNWCPGPRSRSFFARLVSRFGL